MVDLIRFTAKRDVTFFQRYRGDQFLVKRVVTGDVGHDDTQHVIDVAGITTEIRKVPVTVLSRCQRFDLRRVDSASKSLFMIRS